jgi:hypothetical protein
MIDNMQPWDVFIRAVLRLLAILGRSVGQHRFVEFRVNAFDPMQRAEQSTNNRSIRSCVSSASDHISNCLFEGAIVLKVVETPDKGDLHVAEGSFVRHVQLLFEKVDLV